jgi:hypothetical protein
MIDYPIIRYIMDDNSTNVMRCRKDSHATQQLPLMVGTPIALQQKLMRHTDTRTTMNLYGDVVTDAMAQADSAVVGLALSNSD